MPICLNHLYLIFYDINIIKVIIKSVRNEHLLYENEQ
jgi:hypothetical protein